MMYVLIIDALVYDICADHRYAIMLESRIMWQKFWSPIFLNHYMHVEKKERSVIFSKLTSQPTHLYITLIHARYSLCLLLYMYVGCYSITIDHFMMNINLHFYSLFRKRECFFVFLFYKYTMYVTFLC
ncbi:hypothetical protein KP509_1Z310600 [Ceratopteris richardii]|nr:hypothetical protein KP509_1Z310600 [Ceratopteris richardii]